MMMGSCKYRLPLLVWHSNVLQNFNSMLLNRVRNRISHNGIFSNFQDFSVNGAIYKFLTEYFWEFWYKIKLLEYLPHLLISLSDILYLGLVVFIGSLDSLFWVAGVLTGSEKICR